MPSLNIHFCSIIIKYNASTCILFLINVQCFTERLSSKLIFAVTKYIFDQSIWECNGHFDHFYSNTKVFWVAYVIRVKRTLTF